MQELLVLCKGMRNLGKIKKELLYAFLRGRRTEDMHNSKLIFDPFFGVLSHIEHKDLDKLIRKAEEKGLLIRDSELFLTEYGRRCAVKGEFVKKEVKEYTEVTIEQKERDEFEEFPQFLDRLNDEQKKAVVCAEKRILCVAGAGSGKTTVLTKRIEHLVTNKNVEERDILAITFTKKAREHMEEKLISKGIMNVKIKTFNAFGEEVIRRAGRGGKIVEYSERTDIIKKAIAQMGGNFKEIIEEYFEDDTEDYLTKVNKFVNDCFAIRDYFNNLNVAVPEFYKKSEIVENAETVYRIVLFINAYFKKYKLRDYSDQLVDALPLIKEKEFLHVLVDEYQDINSIQEQLISKMKPANLFCVGDPRQSIYGWRGSKLEFIENFSGEIIYLTKNYRCAEQIVELGNKVIAEMELPDLVAAKGEGEVSFNRYETLKEEAISVAKRIKESEFELKDIFVIARTNKGLQQVSEELHREEILHEIKDDYRAEETKGNRVTLLTTHSAKGLEAKEVFVISCSSRLYPCLKSDHKLLEIVKDYYNKREEERRLLYVALTRAEEKLHVSYFGKSLSPFLRGKIKRERKQNKLEVDENTYSRLKIVRKDISEQTKVPEFLIFSNSEMEEMSKTKALDIKDIKRVIGSRANKYGEKILEKLK